MARGKKTGGKNWTKGKSGNPKGRPEIPEEILRAQQMNQVDVARTISRLLRCSIAFLELLAKDKNASGMDTTCAEIVLKAKKFGDPRRLDFMFNRSIGKVPLPKADAPDNPIGTTYVDFIKLATAVKDGNAPAEPKKEEE